MKDDEQLKAGMLTWVISAPHTGMFCKCLLAQIRQASDRNTVDVERMASAGLLSQVLREHRSKGFDEPVAITRQQLLEGGVGVEVQSRGSVLPVSPAVHS